MLVGQKYSVDSTVIGPTGLKAQVVNVLRSRLSRIPLCLGSDKTSSLRSTGIFGSNVVNWINHSPFDVVNLHHFYSGFLSIRQVSKIRKPIVWTFHDMWPFCGSEQYTEDSIDSRWRVGYLRKNRAKNSRGLDVDRFIWSLKSRCWNQLRFSVVCPSSWMADCAKASELFKNCPVHEVPNTMDLSVFRNWQKVFAREILRFPQKGKMVLFGLAGNDCDGRKGNDLLTKALYYISKSEPNINIAVFGQGKPEKSPFPSCFTVHWLGKIHDDRILALAYSAADVMVVPSRNDNLPQTGTEAQACGCPVVAFRTGGLSSVVEHGATGYLAKPFDHEDLANGILSVLRSDCCSRTAAIRARAVHLWSERVIVQKYVRVLEAAVTPIIKN